MNSRNITFEDIAKYTNFSKTTISRYFNNPDSLTEKNQAIIRKALIKLDYRENKLAKALAKGNSEFIGIILPNMFFHYYTEILNQILLSYEQYGYKFLVFIGDNDKEIEKQYLDELLSFQIEGLIVLSDTIPSKELSDYNIPTVTIEREDQFVNSVNTDNYYGASQATEHLIDQDCNLLVHINSEVPDLSPSKHRIKGFIQTAESKDIEHIEFFCDMGNSFDQTKKQLKDIFDYLESNYRDRKKGIFLSNDTYANMFVNLIFRSYGYLPETYKIVGFDNSPIAREGILGITTVSQQIKTITEEAMKLLVELMDNQRQRHPEPRNDIIHKEVKPKLIIRETT